LNLVKALFLKFFANLLILRAKNKKTDWHIFRENQLK